MLLPLNTPQGIADALGYLQYHLQELTVMGIKREFDLETRVTTNGNRIISEIFHSCALNK